MVIEPEKWLSNIWIIEKNSGICIFEQGYMEIKTNPDLVSGFLVAMLNFGKEIADKDLQSIQFNDLKITFKEQEKYIIALAITDNANHRDVETFIELIVTEFNKRYGEKMSNWNGKVDDFNEFGEYVENLVNKKALAMILVKSKVMTAIEENNIPYQDFLKQNLHPLYKYVEERRSILSRRIKETERMIKLGEDNIENFVKKFKTIGLRKAYIQLLKQSIEYNQQLKNLKDGNEEKKP